MRICTDLTVWEALIASEEKLKFTESTLGLTQQDIKSLTLTLTLTLTLSMIQGVEASER